jgi:hypothetical protein
MKKRNYLLAWLLFMAMAFSQKVTAQDVILFQYPTSSAQIAAAKKAGDQKTVDVYKRSDNQIKNAILKGFRNEFTFCPVYFFSSDDYEEVKNKKWDKVKFVDHNLSPVQLGNDIQNYQLANISFFPRELNKVVKDQTEIFEEEPENRFGIGIILNTPEFEPVLGKLRFTPCKIAKRGSIFTPKKRYYVFNGAASFNKKLSKFGSLSNTAQ